MLQIDILGNNKNIFNPDSSQQERNYGIWDLTRSSISYRNSDVRFKSYLVVKDDQQMRMDLVAYSVYGDMKYTGTLLKINGITNPFAVDEGDVIAAPTTKSVDSLFSAKEASLSLNDTSNNPNSKFRNSQEQKKFAVSDSRKDFLAKRANAKNPAPQILPPNVMQDGDRQTVRTNAVIGLAPDVSNASPNPNANI